MNFTLSEDNRLLQDSVNRLVQDTYPFTLREQLVASELGHSEALWRQFAELGWLGTAVPELYGGSELGAESTRVIAEALGRGLVTEPFLSTVVFGAELISRFAGEPIQASLLPAIADGSKQVTLAYAEPRSRYSPNIVELSATLDGEHYRLNGAKGMVLNGHSADFVVLSARTQGEYDELQGISLFLIDSDSPGLQWHHYQTYDGLRASELQLDNVRVSSNSIIGPLHGGFALLDEILDRATAALCAEAVGVMSVLFDMTLDYLKTREQFGQTLGSFQVLQHRMVDMYAALENARSMTIAATQSLDGDNRREQVSAAKIQVNDAGQLIGAQSVQLHGAIAISKDLAAGHYYKRLEAIAALFGNSDYHLGRFVQRY